MSVDLRVQFKVDADKNMTTSKFCIFALKEHAGTIYDFQYSE